MAWYDVFSSFYDASLEPHYRAQRLLAAEALRLEPGLTVLDAPTGTGQSLPHLAEGVGPGGHVIGVDLSAGMIRQARARVARHGWNHVALHEASVTALPPGPPVDRIHVFLGMSVFPDPEAAFASLWARLAPGGRCVLVDVHNPSPGLQGKLVELLAQADLTRRWWEPLQTHAETFERVELPSQPLHGGQIWLAVGTKATN